jgi:predicted nuclease of predicted toxin-antitoxin system
MRFLIDAQLSPRLSERLRGAGHEATHVTEMLPADARDADVARLAMKMQAVLITKDEDFIDLSLRSVLKTPLLWLRCGNMTTASLWARLEPALPTIVSAFENGERMVEVR